MSMNIGTVYLIGAGPGDPGLLTLRGLEILQKADVVVYDRLAHPSLLQYARPDAERLYVGKASALHSVKQEDINAIILSRAKAGKSVARLKGGDPFVFGRGGEEAEECRDAGVPFEIVPGVTSSIAAPAYAGIPVTHRDAASSFAVITGHERDDARESGTRIAGVAEQRRDWSKIANGADTLLFLMGVEALPEIAARLQEFGRAPETPVALVQWGTWSKQKVVTGTLADIVEIVKRSGLTPPAVCVVGEVVKLRERLRWFDNPQTRPLFGKKIVVTRARAQASALSDALRSRGAEPIEMPSIKIERIQDTEAIDKALRFLTKYDWIVFTSANAVAIVADRIDALRKDSRLFGGTRVAAIGPATAEALKQRLNVTADFVPTEAVAEAVIAQWPFPDMTDRRVLIPRAKEARELLPEKLREMGAEIEIIPVYETIMDDSGKEAVIEMLKNGEIDAITLASSSTAQNFAHAISGGDAGRLQELMKGVLVAAIGPVTAKTARELGMTPQLVSVEHTIPGLIAALEAHFRVANAITELELPGAQTDDLRA